MLKTRILSIFCRGWSQFYNHRRLVKPKINLYISYSVNYFHETEFDISIVSRIYSIYTVWPQPIWIKVRDKYHRSIKLHKYLGGPELASIEIPPFRPFLWSKFSKIKNFKKFRIAPKFLFALQYIKNWTKVVPWTNFFCSWKNKLLV